MDWNVYADVPQGYILISTPEPYKIDVQALQTYFDMGRHSRKVNGLSVNFDVDKGLLKFDNTKKEKLKGGPFEDYDFGEAIVKPIGEK